MPARDYPDKRVARGLAKEADLRMLSARIDSDLMEYIRTTAVETRKSKQEIVAEALALHRQKSQTGAEARKAGSTLQALRVSPLIHQRIQRFQCFRRQTQLPRREVLP